MKDWKFRSVLTEDGWLANGVITTDEDGVIAEVGTQASAKEHEQVDGIAIPGLVNAHSHAFQYAMAGTTEFANPGQRDNFWSWRESMYALALRLNPEQVEAIASWLYAGMARMGYTEVVEFHYLHHNPDGQPYNDPGEMGVALCEAARNAGLHLTLVPVYYQQGGFDLPANERQRRFVFPDRDLYWRLCDRLKEVTQQYGMNHGIGLHSLRAASQSDTVALFKEAPDDCVRHIHIAEQQKEVIDCVQKWGARPVEWLNEHVELSHWFNLIHATHIQRHEIEAMTKAGCNAVLCPSTEGNLGDGFFPLAQFHRNKGHWSIGSDSHVCLNPAEELRWLDYGQRLLQERRNLLCRGEDNDSARIMFDGALSGGRRACGRFDARYFAPGTRFDAFVIDRNHPLIATRPKKALATWIYVFDQDMLLGTICRGNWVCRNGQHHRAKALQANYTKTVSALTG